MRSNIKFKVYRITDPSGYPRFLLAKFKTKAEAVAFNKGYTKGLFDGQIRIPFPKSRSVK